MDLIRLCSSYNVIRIMIGMYDHIRFKTFNTYNRNTISEIDCCVWNTKIQVRTEWLFSLSLSRGDYGLHGV